MHNAILRPASVTGVEVDISCVLNHLGQIAQILYIAVNKMGFVTYTMLKVAKPSIHIQALAIKKLT